MPKISIIVPVYNVEKYLNICLDSILAQTFIDWECILVDDGSKDSSGKICDEYAAKDSRFKVFHKENGGVSSARNVGLDNAHGEFVTFCDSDDYVSPNWLESFHFENDKDISIQGFTCLNRPDFEQKYIVLPNPMTEGKNDLTELFEELFRVNNIGYLWCRLFRKKLIDTNHLRFDETIPFQEDELFILQFMCNVNTFQTLSVACYKYKWMNLSKYMSLHPRVRVYTLRKLIETVESCNLTGAKDYKDSQMLLYAIYMIKQIKQKQISLRELFQYIKELRRVLSTIDQKMVNGNLRKLKRILFC